MCGIVGYLGAGPATPVLISELKCLEYRGYDSAGVALVENGRLAVYKAAGKLDRLAGLLEKEAPAASVGIGHTRWATHGIPSDENAHPHMDQDGNVAVVHNGIIENYQEIKQELAAQGHQFLSETDTEVVAHLIGQEFQATGDMVEAIRRAAMKLAGAYALAVIAQDSPDRIYAVNQHYSLAVGLGEGETFLASDSIAVSQYTNKIVRLEQSEIAEVTAGGVKLFGFNGHVVERRPEMLMLDRFVMDKAGYKHYMLKEIHEQPLVMRKTLSKYLSHSGRPVNFIGSEGSPHFNGGARYGMRLSDREIERVERILIIACGTAYYAGLVGKYVIEELCEIPVEVEIASEMRARKFLTGERTLSIAVSQSGETADTLAAISESISRGSMAMGITNRADSHLARIVPNLIVTECGIEVSVAATKTFIAQITSLYLLALYLAEKRGTVAATRAAQLKNTLARVPVFQEQILAEADGIRRAALKYAEAHDMVFIARGINYPIALEGALKLKEISYIHASGYAAGELKHGPIAVLDSHVPVISILVPGKVYDKTLANAEEARARNAQMVAEPQAPAAGGEEAAHTFRLDRARHGSERPRAINKEAP